jgi:hypothetical protein
MTQRKKENALGRGLDALIRNDISVEGDETKVSNKKSNTKNSSKTSPKSNKKVSSTKKVSKQNEIKSNIKTNDSRIDPDLVESVMIEVRKNPRISLWSAKSAAVLRLLKKTKPEFSISKEASALIEDAVKDKYPELWDVFEDEET